MLPRGDGVKIGSRAPVRRETIEPVNVNVQAGLNATGGPGSWMADVIPPNACPICHFTILPMVMNAFALAADHETTAIELILRCSRYECQRLFLAYCEATGEVAPGGMRRYAIKDLRPRSAVPSPFDPVIKRVSDSFTKIYQQAMEAESHSLDQMVGIGLRKALEFLIKDFLIGRDSSIKEKVEKKPLAQCIKEYVDDDNLKGCALRAAWLGNDETHYVRIWTQKDVSDLKMLIRLTTLWIERIEYTEEFIRQMPASGPPPAAST